MSADLTISSEQTGFTSGQVAVLRQIGVEEASEADLAVFFHQCQRTGLDPFARQIYMIGRNSKIKDPETGRETWGKKYTIQTGIDGFRLIARRAVDKSGESLSISQPYYADSKGQWLDFWPYPDPPIAAKVMVKRGGGEFPAVAMFNEYAARFNDGNLMGLWASKPAVMIGKCAEALALRKAFPLDLSGLYTGEEMAAADSDPVEPVGASEAVAQVRAETELQPPSGELVAEIKARQAELGLSDKQLADGLKWVTKGTQTDLNLMDARGAGALADYLKQAVEKQRADSDDVEVAEAELLPEDGDRP